MSEDLYHRPIQKHGGSKYVRAIRDVDGVHGCYVDVYAVIRAFKITCPGLQQAIKKILCAGLRGKGDRVSDIKETFDALFRALQFAEHDQKEEQEALDKLKETALKAASITKEPDGTTKVRYDITPVPIPVEGVGPVVMTGSVERLPTEGELKEPSDKLHQEKSVSPLMSKEEHTYDNQVCWVCGVRTVTVQGRNASCGNCGRGFVFSRGDWKVILPPKAPQGES